MADITTRETSGGGATVKGSPLTNAEVDTNFINLETDKIELTDISVAAEPDPSGDGSLAYNNTTGVFTYTPPADIGGAVTFAAQAGEALSKGDVVYVSGVSGNTPVVSKADADDANKMPAYGLAEASASLNAAVNVVTFGTLYELDTSSFSAGDTVYVSTTAGTLTNSAPTGESSLIQNIGMVVRSHASAGSIKVGGAGRTNATPNLNDGNVFIGNASNQVEARALTGDDISGGTITSFASTGIDDNATGTRLTVTNDGIAIGNTATNPTPVNGTTAVHATASSGAEFIAGTNDTVIFSGAFMGGYVFRNTDSTGSPPHYAGMWAESADTSGNMNLYFAAGSTGYETGTAALTIDASGNTTVNGFTSTGIDDNATSTAITIDSSERTLFSSSNNRPVSVVSTNTNSFVTFQDANSASIGHVKIGSETDDMVFYANAQERMRIDSSGNVGIGTDAPDSNLHIARSAAASLRLERNDTTVSNGNAIGNIHFEHQEVGNEGICATLGVRAGDNNGSGEFVFYTGLAGTTTERLRIDSSGNVGIGASDPSNQLHIASSGSDFATLRLDAPSNTTPATFQIRAHDGDFDIRDVQNSATRMTIDSSGNVGVGIDPSSTYGRFRVGDDNSDIDMDDNAKGQFHIDGNAYAFGIALNTEGAQLYTNSSTRSVIFGTDETERMRITGTGNVGIGTTDPSNGKLQIAASATAGVFVRDSSSSNAAPYIRVQGRRQDGNGSESFSGGLALEHYRTDAAVNNGKALGAIYFGGNHTNGSESNIAYGASIVGKAEGDFNEAADMPTGLAFYTGVTGRALGTANVDFGNERMRIDYAGYIGIGTTAPQMRLHVAENNSGATTDVAQFSNSLMSSSFNAGAKISIGDDSLASRQLELSLEGNGSSEFYAYVRTTEPNGPLFLGTANDAEAVTLASSGYFGINTTSPIAHLSVNSQGSPAATYGIANFAGGGSGVDSYITVSRGGNDTGGIKILRGSIADMSIYVNSAENSIIQYNGGDTADNLIFRSGSAGTERIRFDNNGDVLVGNTVGALALISTTTTEGFGIDASETYVAISRSNNGAALYLNKPGESTATAGDFIQCRQNGTNIGEIQYDGADLAIVQVSDQRLKSNIANSASAGSIIDAMQVRSFDWNDGVHVDYGFVAQELNQAYEPATKVGGDDVDEEPWGIKTQKLIPLLVKEIQDLRARVAQLEGA